MVRDTRKAGRWRLRPGTQLACGTASIIATSAHTLKAVPAIALAALSS
jgi:hypothetical protein